MAKHPEPEPIPGQTFVTETGETGVIEHKKRRRPDRAIDSRRGATEQAKKDVENAFRKLVKAGAPFTVTEVSQLSRRSRNFIYKHFGETIPQAAEESQETSVEQSHKAYDKREASHRERARQAEALNRQLHQEIGRRDERIRDLQAQLRDPEGTLLSDKLSDAQKTITDLLSKIRKLNSENGKLTRQLNGSRANVARERGRNVEKLEGGRVIPLPTEMSTQE